MILRYQDFVACRNLLFTPAHNAVKSPPTPCAGSIDTTF
ncbi:hypothetical protein SynA1528_01955 [Synechococcus sp. A15-28]|nr:hypothetical protein SynA1528_01955 [Synechococcus sp. A15-28]